MTTSHEEQSSSNGTSAASSGEKPDIDQLQAEIEQTRAELGETVEALTAKLDVKSRAKERLTQYKQHASGQVSVAQARAVDLSKSARTAATTEDGKPTPTVLAGAAAVLVTTLTALALKLFRRRR